MLANKRAFDLVQKVPLELDLTEYKDYDQDYMISMMRSISSLFKGVKSINAADTSVNSTSLCQLSPTEEHDINAIQLEELDCSNCRKIELSTAIWDPTNIRRVNLQRCFRLTSLSFVKMLSNISPNMRLEFLGVSHLRMVNLHQQLSSIIQNNLQVMRALDAPITLANRNLKVLALNNSSDLDAQSLHVIRICCPMLEYLFLGGSVLSRGSGDLQFAENQDYFCARLLVEQQIQDRGKILAIELATLLCIWKSLKLIEVTFCMSSEVLQAVTAATAQVRGCDLQILNLMEEEDMRKAVCLVEQCQEDEQKALLMGLECAFCCSSPSKQTLLHLSVMAGNIRQVKILLSVSRKQLVNVKGRYGGTALFRACELGCVEIVKVLIESGADAWTCNSSGEVPLYIAALKGRMNVVVCLLEYFEKAGDQTWQEIQRYGDAWTPLMAAAVGNRLDIVQLLLVACRDIQTFCALQNRYGQTALHIAALRGRFEIVRELISQRECLHLLKVKDSMGRTPVDVARTHSQGEVVQFLQQHHYTVHPKVPA
eukprot:TRINITY_DN18173_c0_g1_i10.p1 TRINITY_DN18173_c0_g1~~TRINITY_DN18173_c0_g1_i10.p1  ORF type:complete len:540 (-),score=70.72 TRINITY_DN18173_c0_g1_i10:115-1734(-)